MISRSSRTAAANVVAMFVMALSVAAQVPPALLLTSDGEGHVGPCALCPKHAGRGGLDRRATALADQRAKGSVILLDAGNWLVGGESVATSGKVMVAAYNQLQYDAVNLSPQDLYWGRDATLALLKDAKFAVVSATLVDAETNQPLVKPFVVVTAGGQKTALLGLCELPPGADALPETQRQLAGLRVRPVAEALDEHLPKAKAESDRVIVLYHGTGRGLRALRAKLANTGIVIAAAGVSRENIADDPAAPVLASDKHGQSIGNASLDGNKVSLEQIALAADVKGDPAMQELLARFAPAPASRPTAVAVATQPALPPVEIATPTTAPATPVQASSASYAGSSPATQSTATAPSKPALPRIVARPALQPKGLAGVDLTEAKVNTAIDRGAAALWKELSERLAAQRQPFCEDDGSDLLAALALVHAKGHEKYPPFAEAVRKYLNRLDVADRSLGTYQSGVICMLIEAFGDPVYLPKLRQIARTIVEFQTPNGSWDYGERRGPFDFFVDDVDNVPLFVEGGLPTDASHITGRKMKRVTPWTEHPAGDYSTSQFALLGLRAAARGHLAIDAETWQRSLDYYRSRKAIDGGWPYTSEQPTSYGSMTCAGICSIAIARYQLGKKDPTDDADIEQGLAWLEKNFTVSSNPKLGGFHFYYLYSLERLGQILETEFIGKYEWYPLGARYLVDAQRPDGTWIEEGELAPRRTSSFALLFLTRATPKLKLELKHGGPGMVKAIGATPPPNRLYLILDGSGSMLEPIGNRTKFDIARAAINEIVAGLPEATEVALRVYGHRKRANEEGASNDTALEIPMAKLDVPAFQAKLEELRPRGRTPMAASLNAAREDLAAIRGQQVTVVLLSDGGEDSMPRRDPVLAAGAFAAVKGVTIHIVGFDINQPEWSQQLRDMAARARAHYWPASKADALVRELRQAIMGVPSEFTVVDPTNRELWRGQFGQSKPLPEGRYQLRTDYAGQPYRADFWVNTDATTGVLFDASRIKPGASTQPAVADTPSTPSPKFCTSCGNRLAAGAKFCTSCGNRVGP